MEHRVRTILMVSNSYESFSIAGDADLESAIYGTSQTFQLKVIPQITTALSAKEALGILAERSFDLVLATANLADMEIGEFAAAAKALHPATPVVMLVFDGRWFDLTYGGAKLEELDWIFAWRGSPSVILSIIKLAEDRANVDRDTKLAAIGTIIVIEDSVERYSALLPVLFTTLLGRTLSLMPDGINESDRLIRSRVRPKVLLAQNFAEAKALAEKYESSLLGIISDLRTYQDDRRDPDAGPRFLCDIATRLPGIPILIQSSEPSGAELARSIGARYLDKRASRMPATIEQFILDDIGFGSFVFTDAHGNTFAHAANLWEMQDALAKVPDASILFHAERDELSLWFRARGETTLAAIVRPLHPRDFDTTSELREFLVTAVAIARAEKHRGAVADFKADCFDPTYPFLVTGKGSLGGKGRGLAFMFQLMSRELKDEELEGIRVRIPNTLVIATGEFDAFLSDNRLDPAELLQLKDHEIKARFCAGSFSQRLMADLRTYLDRITFPLAVRSSSILEDSHHQPCAGLYATYFLPNTSPDLTLRLAELCRAIALVYASMFLENPRQYHQATGMDIAEEKMAVIVQEVVGKRHGDRFYPTLSGVAHSHNYYPVFAMQPEDGAAMLAIGLGKHVVEGGEALRFCPKYPSAIPQLSSLRTALDASQRDFFALDLGADKESALIKLPLDAAEEDGVLRHIGSVVSLDDDRIYNGLNRKGPRLVTFWRLLRHADEPFCKLLRYLLALGRQNLGCALELEFACNIEDDVIDFAFLQIRPFVTQRESRHIELTDLDEAKVLCRSQRAMGNGLIDTIRDIAYISPSRFDRRDSQQAAKLIGELNLRLAEERRPYVLIGPGRFGSMDPWLGIPVAWFQLSGAKVIVEVPAADLPLEPSAGTHFFHNMVSAGIGYLSLPAQTDVDFVRFEKLDAMPHEKIGDFLRLVSLPSPLKVAIDGRKQRAVIALT